MSEDNEGLPHPLTPPINVLLDQRVWELSLPSPKYNFHDLILFTS